MVARLIVEIIFLMYANVKTLYNIPESNIILYVNYILIENFLITLKCQPHSCFKKRMGKYRI